MKSFFAFSIHVQFDLLMKRISTKFEISLISQAVFLCYPFLVCIHDLQVTYKPCDNNILINIRPTTRTKPTVIRRNYFLHFCKSIYISKFKIFERSCTRYFSIELVLYDIIFTTLKYIIALKRYKKKKHSNSNHS